MDTQQRKRPPQRRDGQPQRRQPSGQPAGQAPRQPARQPQRQSPPRSAGQRSQRPAPARKRKKTASPFGKRRTKAPLTSRHELESKLRRQNASLQSRKSVRKPRRPSQPMVYTQPKAFNRNRLLLQLLIVTAVVLAFMMGLSIFFKVETIMVSGADSYSEWAVREASGIEVGDNLLSFSEARASGRIQAELPYVNSVRIGIKLPDTVIIYIEELEVAYAAQCNDGIWWLITSEGRVVEQINEMTAAGYTQIKGITLDNPVVNEQAKAMEASPQGVDATDASGETEPPASETSPVVTVTGAQRLHAALTILQALELNDIVGEAASVDVTNLFSIELIWSGSQFQVNLGDINDTEHDMEYKIACMKKAISQLGEYEMGILDVSFTTWPDEVGYTPYVE